MPDNEIEPNATFGLNIESKEKYTTYDWFPVAKVGQRTRMSDGVVRTLTKEALESSVDTWKNGRITQDHESTKPDLHIGSARFEEPFLYMQFEDKATLDYVTCDKASGRSIEFLATDFDDNSMKAGNGIGLSVLFSPIKPACTGDMGCFDDKNLQETEMTKELQEKVEELPANFAKKEGELETLTANFKAKEAEVETLQGELTTSKTKITDLEGKVAEFAEEKEENLKAKLKADFQSIVDMGKIPAGKIHKEEDRKALEAMFEEDPRQFAVVLAGYKEADFAGEEGAEFRSEATDAQKTDADDLETIEVLHGRK